jgi:enoyl-CoA hydratase/carnithine racemase
MSTAAMSTAAMIAEKADGVGWMTFSHPERHNALTEAMCLQVVEIMADFAADPDVRLCVMKGAGETAFISGADIGALPKGLRPTDGGPPATTRAFDALGAFDKPLLAMVRGWCLGGGVAIAMKADIRISATDGRFGIPAARLGLGYPPDSIRDLVALVGPSRAKSILFTAERLTAEEALTAGLVDEVTAPQDLEGRVAEIARAIAANAPLSLRATKAIINDVVHGNLAAEDVTALLARCSASADFQEGRAAFLEKRAPVFRGV